MTPVEFAECIAVLESGVGREMPKDQAKVWFEVLSDLAVLQLRTAVVRALREHKFAGFPPVGMLREWAGCGATVAIPAQDRAIVAWDAVLQAMRDHGGYQSVQFDDPAVTAAVRSVGGWQYMCELETETLCQFVRPRFLEAYRAHANLGVQAIAAEPLPGILSTDAGRDGYDAPPVVGVETGLPPTRTIGESRPPALPAPPEQVRRLADELSRRVEDEPLPLTKPESVELPSVDDQKAALIERFGLEA